MTAWYDYLVIAFHLPGGIPIYTFSLFLSLGTFVGLIWAIWQSSKLEATCVLESGIWTLLGALVGGRLFFVFFNWSYYKDHLIQTLQVYLGGLSWSGALIGGLIALALYARVAHQLFPDLADALIPLLACLSLSVWLSCWVDGCAYGVSTSTIIGVPSPDEWGEVEYRYPIQLIGALFTLGLFWSSERAARRGNFKPGTLTCLGLLNLALITFGLSLLRADPAPMWRGLRLDAWASLVFAGLGLITMFILYGRRKKKA